MRRSVRDLVVEQGQSAETDFVPVFEGRPCTVGSLAVNRHIR